MRREVWVVAAIAVACLMITAAVLAWWTLKPDPSEDDDMVPMAGIEVKATGSPNLTAYGLLVIPVKVTNLRDSAVDFRGMNITLRLADDSEVQATCNGPSIVSPLATEEFLIIVNSEAMLNISAVHIVGGTEYLNVLVPRPPSDGNNGAQDGTGNDDGNDDQVTKNEPFVYISLEANRPFGPEPSPPYMLTYGVPVEGTLDTWVEDQADAAHIGIMVYFAGLSNDEVYVNASYGGGEPQWTNLYDDGLLGCYGMLLTDQSNIYNDMGWTWMYASGGAEYYNITLSVTTYSLGTHEMRFYAYDQDTGRKISGVEVSSYTVLGTGGKFNDRNYMFDTAMDTSLGSTFTPGSRYHFNFTDTCRFMQYSGEVRSVLAFPYAERVWIVNDGGSTMELTRGEGSVFTFTWNYAGGMADHRVHLMVEIGVAGIPPSEYPYNAATYYLEDARTGSLMSHVDGTSHAGVTIWYQGG